MSYTKEIYIYTSYCPHLECRHSITIEYAKIPMVGTPRAGYKKMSYSCSEGMDCPYPAKDEYGRCPLYMESPDEPR